MFASRTLTKAEKRYSQIDKEGLSFVRRVSTFDSLLFGRKLTLITDHKPTVTAARMEETMKFKYKHTQDHTNADGLSRLLLKAQENNETEDEVNVFYNNSLSYYLLQVKK